MAKSHPALGALRKRFGNVLKQKPQAENIKGHGPKSHKSISAFIDVNTDFEGRLKVDGTMHLNGRFKGQINAGGGLNIGKKALVKADVHANDIIISGDFTGNISADKSVEIQTTGKVIGDIKAPSIIVHPGAVLVGNCLTSQPAPKPLEPEIKPEPEPEPKPDIKLEPEPKPEIKLEPEPGSEPKPKKKKARFRPI